MEIFVSIYNISEVETFEYDLIVLFKLKLFCSRNGLICSSIIEKTFSEKNLCGTL